MRRTLLLILFTSLLTAAACSGGGSGDRPDHRKSPIAIAQVSHNNTYVKVVYGQPYKRGREIFGDLVPYGEVWRTGANEATELTTTRNIRFGGRELPKGTYALFTMPGKVEWTIILNSQLGQWGAFEYDSSFDIFRVTVPAGETDTPAEAFTISFGDVENDSTTLNLVWDSTKVAVPIEFMNPKPSSP